MTALDQTAGGQLKAGVVRIRGGDGRNPFARDHGVLMVSQDVLNRREPAREASGAARGSAGETGNDRLDGITRAFGALADFVELLVGSRFVKRSTALG